jgi:signal peptidase I
MNIRWFLSRSIRQGAEVSRQVEKLINEQRDILPAESINALETANGEFRIRLQGSLTDAEIQKETGNLEKLANELLQPYPNSGIRENIKEIAVAMTTILAFTTFFLQLTKIPTGSMQPTLFGITPEEHTGGPPGFLRRVVDYWVHGIAYVYLIAPADGVLRVDPPKTILPFVKRQTISVGGHSKSIWFPPDRMEEFARLYTGATVRKGEELINLKIITGDHLLVDRLTYNFRHPQRGEIIVFKTRGIEGMIRFNGSEEKDVLYIKRLVALGGETVRIGNDNHLVIDGVRLNAATRHFESLYSPDGPPRRDHYTGHVNGVKGAEYGTPSVAPNFPNEQAVFTVRPHHYLAMGDNTLNSWDSRAWGDLPEQNVIGKCWFVYWPFTSRFGWAYR